MQMFNAVLMFFVLLMANAHAATIQGLVDEILIESTPGTVKVAVVSGTLSEMASAGDWDNCNANWVQVQFGAAFSCGTKWCRDVYVSWHGTHVAGTIAACEIDPPGPPLWEVDLEVGEIE